MTLFSRIKSQRARVFRAGAFEEVEWGLHLPGWDPDGWIGEEEACQEEQSRCEGTGAACKQAGMEEEACLTRVESTRDNQPSQ